MRLRYIWGQVSKLNSTLQVNYHPVRPFNQPAHPGPSTGRALSIYIAMRGG